MVAVGAAEKAELVAVYGDICKTFCECNESYTVYQRPLSSKRWMGNLRRLFISSDVFVLHSFSLLRNI